MDRSPRRISCVGVLVAAALAACTDSVAPPGVPLSLMVRGTVQDSGAGPVEGALAVLHVYSPDSAFYQWPSLLPAAIADSLGEFALTWDSLGSGTIDSVLVQSVAPGCQDRRQNMIIPGSGVPSGEAPVIDITISQLDVHPPARTAPGQYCAFGMHPFWGPHTYILALQIDSVSAGNVWVWGRWDLNYTFSSADDEGTFVGAVTPSLVVLNLTSDPVWHACTTMQLDVPVRSTGEWGPATIDGEQECLPEPAPFTFVADTIIGLFP